MSTQLHSFDPALAEKEFLKRFFYKCHDVAFEVEKIMYVLDNRKYNNGYPRTFSVEEIIQMFCEMAQEVVIRIRDYQTDIFIEERGLTLQLLFEEDMYFFDMGYIFRNHEEF